MTAAPPITLAAWLLERIAEDYEIAYGAAPSPWKEGGWDGSFSGARAVLDRHGERTADCYYGGTYGHVLHFDPTRVLADIEAKRRIVELHGCWHVCATGRGQGATDYADDEESIGPCPTLRSLALPYADAPGYREEWRP